MEKLYSIFPWIEDPFTEEGLKRFQELLSVFKSIIEHSWIRELIGKRRELRIVDLCSGTGIGGIALSKILLGLGYKVDLTLIDLRKSALEKGLEFSRRELGFEPGIIVADMTRELDFEREFDLALMWGYTTPHFNPWNWVKVLVNVNKALKSDGVFLYDETDRHYTIFISGRYEKVFPEEVREDKIVLSIHVSRDYESGFVKKIIVDLESGRKTTMNVYFWDIASSAAFAWLFFEDIDFKPLQTRYRGVLLCRKPREVTDMKKLLNETPTILKHEIK